MWVDVRPLLYCYIRNGPLCTVVWRSHQAAIFYTSQALFSMISWERRVMGLDF